MLALITTKTGAACLSGDLRWMGTKKCVCRKIFTLPEYLSSSHWRKKDVFPVIQNRHKAHRKKQGGLYGSD